MQIEKLSIFIFKKSKSIIFFSRISLLFFGPEQKEKKRNMQVSFPNEVNNASGWPSVLSLSSTNTRKSLSTYNFKF